MPRTFVRAVGIVAVVGLLMASTVPAAAQRSTSSRRSQAQLFADVVRTTTEYRAAIARAIPGYEAELRDATEALEERQSLHKLGILPAAYVEDAVRARSTALHNLDEARTAIDEADRIILESSAQQHLAALPALASGRYESTAMFVRFNGSARWSLRDIPSLEQHFRGAFGRGLPLSAVGQTIVHDRLGLDHHAAVDVAVHPDSAEGEWLTRYLRHAGIPFIGVRSAIPGSSTGAHVHIGAPSGKLVAR